MMALGNGLHGESMIAQWDIFQKKISLPILDGGGAAVGARQSGFDHRGVGHISSIHVNGNFLRLEGWGQIADPSSHFQMSAEPA